jgi:hypothetical protein
MTASWVPSSWDAVKAGDTVRLENADGAVEFTVVKTQQTRDCWHIHSEIGDYSEWGWNLFVPAPTTPELPSEPNTIWADRHGYPWWVTGRGVLVSPGTAYEPAESGVPFVKLEPVATTAKAVLKRVLDEADVMSTSDYGFLERTVVPGIAAEFGVTL